MRDGYYVVGEGLLGTPGAAPGTAAAMSMEADLRVFRFSGMGPKGRQPGDPARRIDTLLSDPLADLPPGAIGGPEPVARRRDLAYRNLTRARMLTLATGQGMLALMRARGVTVTALSPAKIRDGNGGASRALNTAERAAFLKDTPLLF